MKRFTLLAGAAVGLTVTLAGAPWRSPARTATPTRNARRAPCATSAWPTAWDQSSSEDITAEQAMAHPETLFTLADGLKARIVTAGIAACRPSGTVGEDAGVQVTVCISPLG